MTAIERIHLGLTNAFAGDGKAEVRREVGQGDVEYVDVYRYPGRFAGKDWEILAVTGIKGGKVVTGTTCGIWSADPEGTFDHVCELPEAAESGVPAEVIASADGVMSVIHTANLRELALEKDARDLLDLLKDVVLADAAGDEDALTKAMEAARTAVASYRPDLEAEMEPAAPAMSR